LLSRETPFQAYAEADLSGSRYKERNPRKTVGRDRRAVEAALDRLFFVVTELTEPLQLEVSTRIGGLDGKRPITKKGAAQFLDVADLRQLSELLGDGVFGQLKDYRDGVIHARHVNAVTGVGVKIDRRAKVFDYLVSREALEAAYKILVVMRAELDEAVWPAPGSEDTELGVLMELEVGHGETEVHAGVQA
jgi:hypothetical protein